MDIPSDASHIKDSPEFYPKYSIVVETHYNITRTSEYLISLGRTHELCL